MLAGAPSVEEAAEGTPSSAASHRTAVEILPDSDQRWDKLKENRQALAPRMSVKAWCQSAREAHSKWRAGPGHDPWKRPVMVLHFFAGARRAGDWEEHVRRG